MKLHRYLASHGLDAIRDKEMKISHPTEFQDQTDCMALPGILGKKLGRKILYGIVAKRIGVSYIDSLPESEQKEIFQMFVSDEMVNAFCKKQNSERYELARTIREEFETYIICFAKHEGDEYCLDDEITMWNEFAKRRGIRLEFEVEEKVKANYYRFDDVIYTDKHREIPHKYIFDKLYEPEFRELMLHSFCRKYPRYRFEHEKRCFINPAACRKLQVNGKTMRFFNYAEHFKLIGVSFGIECPNQEKQSIIEIVQSRDDLCNAVMQEVESMTESTISYRTIG